MSLIWLMYSILAERSLLPSLINFIIMEDQREKSTSHQPIALVTGANQGVGYQIAKELAANGYLVYLGSRNLNNGIKAASEIGFAAQALQLDVTNDLTIRETFAHIEKEHGHLDLLVNNA